MPNELAKLDGLIELGRRAVQKEEEGKLLEAVDLYQQCICLWDVMCLETKNPQIKAKIQAKTVDFLTKVEELKKAGSTKRHTPSNSRPTTSGSDLWASLGTSPEGEREISHENNCDDRFLSSPPSRGVNSNGHSNGARCSDRRQTQALSEIDGFKKDLASELIKEIPRTTLEDVAGLNIAKQAINEAAIYPRRYAKLLSGRGSSWQAILLYGPPGTGKTLLAKATANAVNATYMPVSSSDLISKWQGDSEKRVRAMFQLARERSPCLVFIDEIDALCSARGSNDSESTRRVKTEFLVQLNGLAEDNMMNVLVLGATNIPWELDNAMLRRFQRRIYIDLPDAAARRKVFEQKLSQIDHDLTDKDIDELVSFSEGFSADDINTISQDAFLEPIRVINGATHFRPIVINNKQKFVPLSTGSCAWGDSSCKTSGGSPQQEPLDSQALPLSYEDLDPHDIVIPPVRITDFRQVQHRAKRTVGPDLLHKFEQWTQQMGIRG